MTVYFSLIKHILPIMAKFVCTDENFDTIVRLKYSQNNETIDLSNLDTSQCTSFMDSFNYMPYLKEIKGFDKIDTSHITNMQCMCTDCTLLVSLDLSKCDLSNVNAFTSMCEGCKSLTYLKFPNNLSCNVTKRKNNNCHDYHHDIDMSNMCNNCKSLRYVDLSGLILQDNITIDTNDAFNNCVSLIGITLSHNMTKWFHQCIVGCDERKQVFDQYAPYLQKQVQESQQNDIEECLKQIQILQQHIIEEQVKNANSRIFKQFKEQLTQEHNQQIKQFEKQLKVRDEEIANLNSKIQKIMNIFHGMSSML